MFIKENDTRLFKIRDEDRNIIACITSNNIDLITQFDTTNYIECKTLESLFDEFNKNTLIPYNFKSRSLCVPNVNIYKSDDLIELDKKYQILHEKFLTNYNSCLLEL